MVIWISVYRLLYKIQVFLEKLVQERHIIITKMIALRKSLSNQEETWNTAMGHSRKSKEIDLIND